MDFADSNCIAQRCRAANGEALYSGSVGSSTVLRILLYQIFAQRKRHNHFFDAANDAAVF